MRIIFVSDSLTLGVGDPAYLGWVGRLCSSTPLAGLALTVYNLGVCSENSLNIKARLRRELPMRLLPRHEAKLVLSFGVNDAKMENCRRKLSLTQSLEACRAILAQATSLVPVLFIGPPPVLDYAHLARVEELSDAFAQISQEMCVPNLEMCRALTRDPVYFDSLNAVGDGCHPGATGYQAIAQRVLSWDAWQALFRQ